MAIIQAHRKFEGSNIENQAAFAYIRADVRQIKFDKKTNTDGLYLIFLPAYKQDSQGNGVWFKKINIRNNFGIDKVKKAYVVKDANSDPASYFERNFKGYYPDQAKPVPPNGQNKFTTYPSYGHITNRVIYNVAILAELTKNPPSPIDKVVHVLDLPSWKGADQLMNWMNSPQPDGTSNPLINDHTAAVPVFVKMSSEVGPGGGWTLSPTTAQRYNIPDVYADSNNLYNLDDIYIEKSNEEIISDLRSFYPASVFDACMDGFPGFKRAVIPGVSIEPQSNLPVASLTLPAPPRAAPAIQITTLPPPVTNIVTVPAPPVFSTPLVNPVGVGESVVVNNTPMTKADLKNFLQSKAQ